MDHRSVASCLAFVGWALVGAAGCAPYSDFCEQKMECLGGNEADIAACEADWDGDSSEADAYDCGDVFDAYFECKEENSSCHHDDMTGSESYSSGDDCRGEDDDLEECIHDASSL